MSALQRFGLWEVDASAGAVQTSALTRTPDAFAYEWARRDTYEFYRKDYPVDVLNHISFDRHRRRNSHRHTPADVRSWCDAVAVVVERFDVQEAGIPVVARRPSPARTTGGAAA